MNFARLYLLSAVWAGLVWAGPEKETEEKTSYEQLFHGAQRPYAEAGPPPQAGSTPEQTVRALYGNEIFFHQRNAIPKQVTQHLQGCFTPSLLAHFNECRTKIETWLVNPKNEGMKLPMSEGSIFLSCYEGGSSFKVGKAVITGDEARVPVLLTYEEAGETYPWVDMAILRKSGGQWRLDDIRFQPNENTERTLRGRITLEE
ncbi:MAG: hypothetical protein V4599_05035 [Verrucomicrobiota bacterium]